MYSYTYTRLQQPNDIRILDLCPGTSNQPLRGTLRHMSLDEDEEFEAISCVWGPDVKDCVLETTAGRINITSSLNSALQRLRLTERSRALWADALCINQQDNMEKSLQVRLMDQIYGKAARVLAYLGEDADNSELAQPLLERMASRVLFDEDPEGVSARLALKAEDFESHCSTRAPAMIYFGSSDIHWKTFYQAIDNTFSFDELSLTRNETDRSRKALTNSGAIAFSTLDMGRDKSSTSLLERFDLFQDKKATKNRDHLFALLSLARDADDRGFDPDYLEPLESIVCRYAAVFVRRGQTFTLLATAGLGPYSSRFPSWIPNWTKKRAARYSTGIGSSMATYNAAGMTEVDARYDVDADELTVRGIIFDQVEDIIHISDKPLDDSPLINEHDRSSYLEKCDAAVQSLPSYPTGESLFDVQWRTLIVDRDEDGSELTQTDQDRMRRSYLTVRQNLKRPVPNTATDDDNAQDASIEANPYDFESAAFYWLAPHATLCITARGYIGLVPKNSAKGDWICVLYGCPVPFVVRKSALRDGDIFQLVQMAYVHGIMMGEALLDESSQEQDICLH